jgi:transposase
MERKIELFRKQMEQEGINTTSNQLTDIDYKKKYELAMKLLAEKELEVAVLKEALKKNEP